MLYSYCEFILCSFGSVLVSRAIRAAHCLTSIQVSFRIINLLSLYVLNGLFFCHVFIYGYGPKNCIIIDVVNAKDAYVLYDNVLDLCIS